MRVSRSTIGLMVYMAIAVATPDPGRSLEQKKPDQARGAEARAPQSDVQQFCLNNAGIIGDARIAWQTARLAELGAQIRARLAELEAKKTEYEAWLRARDEMMKQAAEGVVTIYAKMRPDAAALQIAAMDDPTAAAILVKLPARAASAILNEMEAGRAARLTRSMVGPDSMLDGKKS